MVNIRGTTSLIVNMLFTMVRDLEAKVDILTDRSKSTKEIFYRKTFSSEMESIFWFTSRNLVGEGMAAWVDIISIWTFETADIIDTTQWFTKLHWSKFVGLKGSVDVAYVHLMSTCYPTLFVGKAKVQILSTTTIKMFNSHGAWRGEGAWDGNKQWLMDMLVIAVRHYSYRQYFEENLPEGELRAMALHNADVANTFWEQLVAYISDEYSLQYPAMKYVGLGGGHVHD